MWLTLLASSPLVYRTYHPSSILDIAKTESGMLELQMEACDVASMVKDVASSFSIYASSKGVELACLCEAETPPMILLDKIRMRQTVFNLGVCVCVCVRCFVVCATVHDRVYDVKVFAGRASCLACASLRPVHLGTRAVETALLVRPRVTLWIVTIR